MKTKNFIPLVVAIIVITLFTSSCRATYTASIDPAEKSIPPGQAKKITGSQSAKPYAPGQQKK